MDNKTQPKTNLNIYRHELKGSTKQHSDYARF